MTKGGGDISAPYIQGGTMAIKKKVDIVKEEVKEKKVEKKYVCTELCYHNGTMFKKGDILTGEPPLSKDGAICHFEELK